LGIGAWVSCATLTPYNRARMTKNILTAGVDFGLSNTDVIIQRGAQRRRFTVPAHGPASVMELERVLAHIGVDVASVGQIAITGGQHKNLPGAIGQTKITHVDEMTAIGLGGLALGGATRGLVVSAGTGTAMVAARETEAHHVTGSAVGGGTMLGLGALLLKTTDPHEIDALALAGDRNGVDLSIAEAIGGKIAGLPPTATASNFGRVGRNPRTKPSRQDLAAAIITLVAQTISVIAINAARAESLPNIVFVGHMMDMASMRKACLAVANLYRVKFTIAKTPGLATAMGALQGLGGVAPTPNP